MILDDLVAATQRRLIKEKAQQPLAQLQKQVAAMPITKDFPFERMLHRPGLHFICEIKKASPSKGLIAADFPYLQIAREYVDAGADAISVLTEPDYFQGSLSYLKDVSEAVKLPTLRKDFTIDPYMIYEAKVNHAQVILLICAILTQQQLQDYLHLADELGLSVIVEAHDEAEVKRALSAGARIVGVNNRNLKDFSVDLNTSLRLRKLVPKEIAFISESGISQPVDIMRLKAASVNAVLIGETMMRAKDKKGLLQRLKGQVTA